MGRLCRHPNRMGRRGDTSASAEYSAYTKTMRFQRDSSANPSPIPIENCPWCGEKFDRNSFRLIPSVNAPTDLRVHCVNSKCAFSGDRCLADSGRGRTDLPPLACVPHRDGGQVCGTAVDGRDGDAVRFGRTLRRGGILRPVQSEECHDTWRAAAAAGTHHPGRIASHLRPARNNRGGL